MINLSGLHIYTVFVAARIHLSASNFCLKCYYCSLWHILEYNAMFCYRILVTIWTEFTSFVHGPAELLIVEELEKGLYLIITSYIFAYLTAFSESKLFFIIQNWRYLGQPLTNGETNTGYTLPPDIMIKEKSYYHIYRSIKNIWQNLNIYSS